MKVSFLLSLLSSCALIHGAAIDYHPQDKRLVKDPGPETDLPSLVPRHTDGHAAAVLKRMPGHSHSSGISNDNGASSSSGNPPGNKKQLSVKSSTYERISEFDGKVQKNQWVYDFDVVPNNWSSKNRKAFLDFMKKGFQSGDPIVRSSYYKPTNTFSFGCKFSPGLRFKKDTGGEKVEDPDLVSRFEQLVMQFADLESFTCKPRAAIPLAAEE